jgi:hypothetical protein
MKLTIEEVIEKALEFGDVLEAFNENGEWKTNELRDKCYSLVYQNFEVEE